MSLATRNENCSYYNSKDLTAIVFDIATIAVVLATRKSDPPAAAFGLKIVRFLLSCVQILY